MPKRTVEERFWEKVERRGPDECWLWLGGKTGGGYGYFWLDGRMVRAHRFAYGASCGTDTGGDAIGSRASVWLHELSLRKPGAPRASNEPREHFARKGCRGKSATTTRRYSLSSGTHLRRCKYALQEQRKQGVSNLPEGTRQTSKSSSVSVVLPAYVPNEELLEVTTRCLLSLHETEDDFQLIVIDNGSFSGASEELAKWADLYFRHEEPIGYARAVNIALETNWLHDWVCVINTDLDFIQDGWLEQLQRDYLETQGGILSPMDSEGEKKIHLDKSWFSCWLTHRSVIQKVGYFDESLPYRFHDQDYAIRVKRAGYEVMRDGAVQVRHIDSATYDVMNHDDSDERALMEKRWNAIDFNQWLHRGSPAPT